MARKPHLARQGADVLIFFKIEDLRRMANVRGLRFRSYGVVQHAVNFRPKYNIRVFNFGDLGRSGGMGRYKLPKNCDESTELSVFPGRIFRNP